MRHYIVCDLDDCLLRTDLLYEQWLQLLKMKPFVFFASPFWLFKGKSFFKAKLSEHVSVSASQLPYREDVLDFLKASKAKQTSGLILASASPLPWVKAVADHLGLFDVVLGSSESANLKGSAKLQAIQTTIGENSFTYIGDHPVDLEIWQKSAEVVAVNPSPGLQQKISSLGKPTQVIRDQKNNLWSLLWRQLRPHQWIKNTLVFLPAFAGHTLWRAHSLKNGFLAFAGFSLAASFVYVINDLLDLKSDRNHHTKKLRPFASGDLPIKWGLALLPFLLIGVLAFSALLPLSFSAWILVYLVLNLAYSLYLKQSVVVDIIALSTMYTLRIFAGAAATDVFISEWLLSFSTLFFFSLACVKRYTEIIRSKNKITLDGRGYRQIDHTMVQSLGVGSGLISILIVLLYLQSKEVRALYTSPQNLWFTTPILLFWISRIWILTNRDEVHDDPVVFAVKDKMSWICLGLLALVFGFSV